MVAGDVFRAPKDPLLLCVEVGSGVQILCSAFITLLFATLGALPATRCAVEQMTHRHQQKSRSSISICGEGLHKMRNVVASA